MQIIVYCLFIFYVLTYILQRGQLLNNIHFQRVYFGSFVIISLTITIASGIDYIDKIRYTRHFIATTYNTFGAYLEIYSDNVFFYTLNFLIGKITSSPDIYYVIIHLIFLCFFLCGIYLIFNKNLYLTVLAFFLYLNYSFYYSYTLNVLRQGLSIALIFFSIGLILNNKKINIITLVVSPLIHWSSIFFTLLVWSSRKIQISNIKLLSLVYAFFSILYITNMSGLFTNSISFILPENTESYINLNRIDYYGGSYKITFWLFNTFFWLLFLFPFFVKRLFNQKLMINYKLFFYFYTINSSVFFLFGFIPFADRIAGYSWLLIPILLTIFIDSIKIPKVLKLLLLFLIMIIGYFTTPLDGRFL